MTAERITSPCYDCPDKNYIGKCMVGCTKYSEYQAKKKESIKKREQQNAADAVLISGIRKYEKEKRRAKRR